VIFDRIDDIDGSGNRRVRYLLSGTTFEIRATKVGVSFTGTSPEYSDYTYMNQAIQWQQYNHQKLKETGRPVPQEVLQRGEI